MSRRRWTVLVLAAGAVLSAGAAIAGLGPDSATPPTAEDPLAMPVMPTTLPVDIATGGLAAPGASTAGVTQGQSVVAPAQRPSPPIASPTPTIVVDPQTVRAGDIRLAIDAGSYRQVFERVASIAVAHGGFVASSSSFVDQGASAGQLALRVPVENFDAARRDVAELGDIEAETIRGQDVSAQLIDYEARQRSLEVQEEALRALVGKATTVGEVLQIQPTLTNVRQQIEQLQGQRASLAKAAALSTILVAIHEPGASSLKPAPTPAKGLGRRVEQAADGALAVVGGMIVAVGWAMPVLAVGALGYLVFVIRRRRGLHPAR